MFNQKSNFNTKQGRLKLSVISLALVTAVTATTALALSYNTNQPLIYTVKNDYGKWFAGGPVQYTSAGLKTESEAIDLVYNSRHGSIRYIGAYGKCRVYQGDGVVESYDISAERIARKMERIC